MRGIRGELPLRLKSRVQPSYHLIKALRKTVKLVVALFHLNSLLEVSASAYHVCRFRDVVYRTKHPARYQISSDYRHKKYHRKYNQGYKRYLVHLQITLKLRHHSPEPQPVKSGTCKLSVEYIEKLPSYSPCPYDRVRKLHTGKLHSKRIFTVHKRSVRAVQRCVDLVDLVKKIVVNLEIAILIYNEVVCLRIQVYACDIFVILYLVYIVLNRLQKGVAHRLLYDLTAD